MERLKSKTTLLVALVLAAVLAMAGVGYALANPNDGSDSNFDRHAAMHEKTTAELKAWLLELSETSEDLEACPFCGSEFGPDTSDGEYYCDNYDAPSCIDSFKYNPDLRVKDDNPEWYNVDWNMEGQPCGSLMCNTISNIVDELPADSAFIQWLMGKDDSSPDESTSGIAFNFHFKATGIQSTGFNDYHEAFAALNN